MLEIKDLHVSVDGKEILKGVTLTVKQGEIHALMGPNGSGKSTLSYTVMGHPRYKVDSGEILFDGQDITSMAIDKRAKLGLFLSFQYPQEIPGVSMVNFMRTALNNKRADRISVGEFQKLFFDNLELFKMDKSFAGRYLNDGFSGGEKKRSEILQLAVLKPKVAILDETDSGLDIDALRVVADGINKLAGPDLGVLVITHYQRILRYINPNYVHILVDGKIVKSGDHNLAAMLEEKGYEHLKV